MLFTTHSAGLSPFSLRGSEYVYVVCSGNLVAPFVAQPASSSGRSSSADWTVLVEGTTIEALVEANGPLDGVASGSLAAGSEPDLGTSYSSHGPASWVPCDLLHIGERRICLAVWHSFNPAACCPAGEVPDVQSAVDDLSRDSDSWCVGWSSEPGTRQLDRDRDRDPAAVAAETDQATALSLTWPPARYNCGLRRTVGLTALLRLRTGAGALSRPEVNRPLVRWRSCSQLKV